MVSGKVAVREWDGGKHTYFAFELDFLFILGGCSDMSVAGWGRLGREGDSRCMERTISLDGSCL